jgi:hypothetical protein
MSAEYTSYLHQRFPLVGICGGGAIAPGTVLSSAIDFGKCRQLLAVVFTGTTLGTTPTVNFKFQSSATAAGTYADVNANWKITPLTAANKQCTLLLRAESMNQQGASEFVKGLLTVGGTGNSECGALIFAGDFRYDPPQGLPLLQLSTVLGNYVFTN